MASTKQTRRRQQARVMTPTEVSEILHVGRTTVWRMIKDGKLPAVRIGNIVRVPIEAVEELLRPVA